MYHDLHHYVSLDAPTYLRINYQMCLYNTGFRFTCALCMNQNLGNDLGFIYI